MMLLDPRAWSRHGRRRVRRSFKEYLLALRRGNAREALEWLAIAEMWWEFASVLEWHLSVHGVFETIGELLDLNEVQDAMEEYEFPEEFDDALEARLRAMIRAVTLHEHALEPENDRKRFDLYNAAQLWSEAAYWWKWAATYWQTGPRKDAEDAERRAREAEERAQAKEDEVDYEYDEPYPDPEPPPPNLFTYPPGTTDVPPIPPTAV